MIANRVPGAVWRAGVWIAIAGGAAVVEHQHVALTRQAFGDQVGVVRANDVDERLQLMIVRVVGPNLPDNSTSKAPTACFIDGNNV